MNFARELACVRTSWNSARVYCICFIVFCGVRGSLFWLGYVLILTAIVTRFLVFYLDCFLIYIYTWIVFLSAEKCLVELPPSDLLTLLYEAFANFNLCLYLWLCASSVLWIIRMFREVCVSMTRGSKITFSLCLFERYKTAVFANISCYPLQKSSYFSSHACSNFHSNSVSNFVFHILYLVFHYALHWLYTVYIYLIINYMKL